MARRSEPRFRFAPPIYPATERLPHRPKLSLFPLWTKYYLTAASDSIEMLLEIRPIHAKFGAKARNMRLAPTQSSFGALSSPMPQASKKTLEKDASHDHGNR